jgi:hypothetical protein
MIQQLKHTCKIGFGVNITSGIELEKLVVKTRRVGERELDGQ